MDGVIGVLAGIATLCLMAWLALGRLPVLGGMIKSLLKLAFLSAPLVAVAIFAFFAIFKGSEWFGAHPLDRSEAEPLPVLVVRPTPAAPPWAPVPPKRSVTGEDAAAPLPRVRPDE